MVNYVYILSSSVGERDGMAFELWTTLASDDEGNPKRSHHDRWLAEIFEDDETKERSLTVFTQDPIPLAVFEEYLETARRRL